MLVDVTSMMIITIEEFNNLLQYYNIPLSVDNGCYFATYLLTNLFVYFVLMIFVFFVVKVVNYVVKINNNLI